MTEIVTLAVSERVTRNAAYVAAQTHQRMEDVLAEWLEQVTVEPPVASLPDDEVLALCDMQMDPAEQVELGALLAANREGALDRHGQIRLDALMQIYRHGLVRKAQALHIAVRRGLRPPLSNA